jgi:hypothetical protein
LQEKVVEEIFINDSAAPPEPSASKYLQESQNVVIDSASAVPNVLVSSAEISTQVEPLASNGLHATNNANLSRKDCVTNLLIIFDAAVRVGKKSNSGVPRLPVDLMLLRSELTNASVFLCPSDPNSANAPVRWEDFDPKFISYRFSLDIIRGTRDTKIGIDYPYLRCPIHNLRLTGNRNISRDKSGNQIHDDY